VSLVPDSEKPTKRFAVVVSMCHGIADGHTFYQVHNMLGEGRRVTALDPQRVNDASAAAERAMGGPGWLSASSWTGWHFANLAWGILWLLCGQKAKSSMFMVDEGHISKRKHEAKSAGEVDFVSTNDIVTSEMLSASGVVDTAMMAVNFRNKISCIGDSHAGNYENCIFYRPPDFATPSLVRKSVSSLRRASTPPTRLLQGTELLSQVATLVTNWATFDRGLELPGCAHDLHLPLYDCDKASIPKVLFLCLVFRPSQGRTAVMLVGSEEWVRACGRAGIAGEPLPVAW